MKNQKGFISSGVIALVAVLLIVGLVGWYLLNESQKINDEYDDVDQANSSLIKPADDDKKTDSSDTPADTTDDTTEATE